MNKVKFVTISAACLFLAAGFVTSRFSSVTVRGASDPAASTPTPGLNLYADSKAIPTEIAYWALFQEIQQLRDKDSESLAQGESTTFKNSFYTNQLGLQTAQFAAVDSAATQCLSSIQPVDQQARQIINQYRSQFPNGELKQIQPTPTPNKFQPTRSNQTFQSLPPAPAELSQLQNQKNQIILNAKESIRQSLGQSAFDDFDKSVRKNATRVLVPLDLSGAGMPSLPPTP